MKHCVTFKTFLKHVNGEFTVCSLHLNPNQNVYALAWGADVISEAFIKKKEKKWHLSS